MSKDLAIPTSEFLPPARDELRRALEALLKKRSRETANLERARRKLTKLEMARERGGGTENPDRRLIREALAAEHDRLAATIRALDVEIAKAEQAVQTNVTLRSLAEFSRLLQALTPRLREYLRLVDTCKTTWPLVALSVDDTPPWRELLYGLGYGGGSDLEKQHAFQECIAAFRGEGLEPWVGGTHE